MRNYYVVIHSYEKGIALEGFLFNQDSSTFNIVLFEPEDNKKLHYQDHVSLTVFHDFQGEKTYEANVASFKADAVILEDVAHIKTIQRRQDSRAILDEKIIVNKIQMPNKESRITLPKPIFFQGKNISAGGMLLSSKIELPKNVHLFFKFNLLNIDIHVSTIRIENRSNNYEYGCKFIGLHTEDQDRIRQFVFKRQMEERRGKNK